MLLLPLKAKKLRPRHRRRDFPVCRLPFSDFGIAIAGGGKTTGRP